MRFLSDLKLVSYCEVLTGPACLGCFWKSPVTVHLETNKNTKLIEMFAYYYMSDYLIIHRTVGNCISFDAITTAFTE